MFTKTLPEPHILFPELWGANMRRNAEVRAKAVAANRSLPGGHDPMHDFHVAILEG
jgi:hypothetical protein